MTRAAKTIRMCKDSAGAVNATLPLFESATWDSEDQVRRRPSELHGNV